MLRSPKVHLHTLDPIPHGGLEAVAMTESVRGGVHQGLGHVEAFAMFQDLKAQG